MQYKTHSKVESCFLARDFINTTNKEEYQKQLIIVDNYVELGQLTALRFLEWVCMNPGGVIALPTGKTPEFFIKWVEYYLHNWEKEMKSGILKKIELSEDMKPDMHTLYFFQLDEFFPINPEHERSFHYFIKKYYLKIFGLDEQKMHFIDTYNIPADLRAKVGGCATVTEVFPDGHIDLGLRTQKPTTSSDQKKQFIIRHFDQKCADYEDQIRNMGGIGFFLGGIGPDGHVAFNVKGSSHHSHTRLTGINYETQAAAATDLGGIELVRKKAVITIGLETITYNQDAVAIVMAAGESKSGVLADAVQKNPSLLYPATALHKLPAARFFATRSAGVGLNINDKTIRAIAKKDNSQILYAHKLVIDAALSQNISLVELNALSNKESVIDSHLKLASELAGQPLDTLIHQIIDSLTQKIENGIRMPENQRILHTAPHHDDIELAYFPLIHHLVRSPSNKNNFCYCTSGFTAVTNQYIANCLSNIEKILNQPIMGDEAVFKKLPDLSYAQEDITGYLNAIAQQDEEMQLYYLSCRIIRLLYNHLSTDDAHKLQQYVKELIQLLNSIEPGRKEPDIIHDLKGWSREFEAELVWSHFGIDMHHVSHLRLHFYTDDIFPQYPDHDLDVMPIFELLEKLRPTIISLALDPEGSGPDTHFKTLIALSEAMDMYAAAHPDMNLKIWGYRNIWSRYQIHESSAIIPVSLNSFAVLHNMFHSCFLSQKSASFPSYELDGSFSELAQKIWVNQHNDLLTLLGKDYFYNSPNPLLRRAFGAIYLKQMNYQQFKEYIKPVKRLLKAKEYLGK